MSPDLRFGRVVRGLAGVGSLAVLLAAGSCDKATRPGSFALVWEDSLIAHAAAAIIGNVAVVGTFEGVAMGFDLATGRRLWERTLSPAIWGRRVLAVNGLAIIPEYELWALNPLTGDVVWRLAGPDGAAGVVEPALAGDTLFAASGFGWLLAVDGATGTILWQAEIGERVFRPTIHGDTLFIGTRGFVPGGGLGAGHVMAVQRSTGAVLWQTPLPDSAGFPYSGGATHSGVVANDILIIGTQTSHVLGLRPSDGAILWRATGGAPNESPYDRTPAVLEGRVIFARGDGVVEARHPADGALLWSTVRRGTSGPSDDPISRDGLFYVTNGPIRAFRPDGSLAWETRGPYEDFGFFGAITITADGGILASGEDFSPSLRSRYLYLRPE